MKFLAVLVTLLVILTTSVASAIEHGFIFIEEDNRMFTLTEEVKSITILTDEEIIRINEDGTSKTINYKNAHNETSVRAMVINPNIFPEIHGKAVNNLMERVQTGLPVNTGGNFIIVDLGGNRFNLRGTNARIVAGDRNSKATLGNYPIHYRDIPKVVSQLCSNGLPIDYPQCFQAYTGELHQALKVMEFMQMIYSEKRFEEGEFARESEMFHAFKRNGIQEGFHSGLTIMALALTSKNALCFKEEGRVNMQEVYYAHFYMQLTMDSDCGAYMKSYRRNLDDMQEIGALLMDWINQSPEEEEVHRSILSIFKKYSDMWEQGTLPMSPEVINEFERLGLGATQRVTPTPLHKLTTWGELKK